MQSRHKENTNIDTKSNTFQFKKKSSPPIQIDLDDINCVAEDDVRVSVDENEHQDIDNAVV